MANKQKDDDEKGPEIQPPAAPANEPAPVVQTHAPLVSTQSFQSAERQVIDLEKEGFKGQVYVKKNDPRGFKGCLKIDPDGAFGRTHIVKSQLHYWQGTEDAFRDQFEKE